LQKFIKDFILFSSPLVCKNGNANLYFNSLPIRQNIPAQYENECCLLGKNTYEDNLSIDTEISLCFPVLWFAKMESQFISTLVPMRPGGY
jgi:hypothetical protein